MKFLKEHKSTLITVIAIGLGLAADFLNGKVNDEKIQETIAEEVKKQLADTFDVNKEK